MKAANDEVLRVWGGYFSNNTIWVSIRAAQRQILTIGMLGADFDHGISPS
jgi:hypothetical protein